MSTQPPNKFSSFVEGIVDRKLRAISLGFTSAASYFKTLIDQATAAAKASLDSSVASANSSTNAFTSYSATALLFQNFGSTYLGVAASDPILSTTGRAINPGAFYVRSTDLHLRVVTSFNNGNPVWGDATVVADQTSVLNIVTGKFLSLSTTDIQSVNGPVRFLKSISVIDVTDWASSLPVPAKQVQSKFDIVQQTVYTERDRAQAIEQTLRNDITAVNNNVNAVNDNANNKNAATNTRIDNVNTRIDGVDSSISATNQNLATLSSKTVTALGLVTGGGRNDQDFNIEVKKASGPEIFTGTVDDKAVTPAGLDAAGAVYVDIQVTGPEGYRKWSDGLIECWGSIGVGAGQTVYVTLPTPHVEYCIPVGSCSINQDEASIGVLNATASGFNIRNRNPLGTTFYWHTRGR